MEAEERALFERAQASDDDDAVAAGWEIVQRYEGLIVNYVNRRVGDQVNHPKETVPEFGETVEDLIDIMKEAVFAAIKTFDLSRG